MFCSVLIGNVPNATSPDFKDHVNDIDYEKLCPDVLIGNGLNDTIPDLKDKGDDIIHEEHYPDVVQAVETRMKESTPWYCQILNL